MQRVKTGISKAYWCARKQKRFGFDRARVRDKGAEFEGREIAWFDELFEGGIVIPSPEGAPTRALTILISGPPGSGKSTLALELAYRLREENKSEREKWHCLYVTSESSGLWLKKKIESYGWPQEDVHYGDLETTRNKDTPEIAHLDILETDEVRRQLETVEASSAIGKVLEAVAGIFGRSAGEIKNVADRRAERIQEKKVDDIIQLMKPGILVIDSLNTVEHTKKSELFRRFSELAAAGPKILAIILDTATPRAQRGAYEFWAYVCDTIIRLDKRYDSNYMVRTIEIEKARYQSHVWGVHQLKIYGPNQLAGLKNRQEDPRRAHPYREEGGIFIFPSIHYYLSSYKRKSPPDKPRMVDTLPKEFNDLLHGGLPEERCTGLVGERGNHKSHLGYVHILHRILHYEERGLIISLRDGEGVARTTLQRILDEQEEFKKFRGQRLDDLEKDDSLEILYYPPGYITPEEFYHRMYLSIQRLMCRMPNRKITLLFNSLDQLGARFPLCAREQVFIPGIIETLCAERITSLFIGVNEPGQPEEQYGLLSMADLVLSFEKRTFQPVDYKGHLEQRIQPYSEIRQKEARKRLKKSVSIKPRAVVLRVERFAGGQTAGRGGILELVREDSPLSKFYCKRGLCFTEFSPSYSEGFKPVVGLSPGGRRLSPEDEDLTAYKT
ncbi:MAG: hypothetical protein JSU70_02555 [Phycisphaerales bacterium]|nr:MAG: hypothetical protein JSU70_02555 [Phycisphaerales bacterium]